MVEPPSVVEDPSIVRCGIDDRPRKLGLADFPGELRAKRAPPDPEPIAVASAMPVAQSPRVRVAEDVPPPEVRVAPHVTHAPPQFDGAPVSTVAAEARLDDRVNECADLVTSADEGHLELTIVLARSGEPLTVRASRKGTLSPYVRCLMDRGCAVRPGPAAGGHTMTLPLDVELPAPTVVVPPQPIQPDEALVVQSAVAAALIVALPGCSEKARGETGLIPLVVRMEREAVRRVRPRPMPGGPRDTQGVAAPMASPVRVVRVAIDGPTTPARNRFAACLQTALIARPPRVSVLGPVDAVRIQLPPR